MVQQQVSLEAHLDVVLKLASGLTVPSHYEAGKSAEFFLRELSRIKGINLMSGLVSRERLLAQLYQSVVGVAYAGRMDDLSILAAMYTTLDVESPGNLVSNGDFEANATGWSVASGSIVQALASAEGIPTRYNAGILKVTMGAGTTAIAPTAALVLTAAPYVAGYSLYIPTVFDGTSIGVRFTGYVGGTNNDVIVNADLTKRNQWQDLTSAVLTPVGGDLSGTVQYARMLGATAGRVVYVDGARANAGSTLASFIGSQKFVFRTS